MKRLIYFFVFTNFLLLKAQQTVGLIKHTNGSIDGYILFAPLSSNITYLIDKCGRPVHTWKSNYTPRQSAYLLPDGSLLRTGNDSVPNFSGRTRGIIEKFDWDNNLLWSYRFPNLSECQHHDICPLPNGNILVLAWDLKGAEEVIELGRDPEQIGKTLWAEKIIELKPISTNSATIVWEWRVLDHIIQDYNASAPNYGVVSENPQLFDINFLAQKLDDWQHFNSVSYNAKLDQIVISNRNHSEFFIIDHSTTARQAASHKGGKRNKGGDILYRWGNPMVYRTGTKADQQLYGQHHPHWIPYRLKDGGKILLFNNGFLRPEEKYSSVEIIDLPVDKKGNYKLTPGVAYLPEKPMWQYTAPNPTRFFSVNISNAQRLPKGNTLICSGAHGHFFEIDENKNVVWYYINPINDKGAIVQGSVPIKNHVFRCLFYEPSYSAFSGRNLTPGSPLEINPINVPCSAK